MSKMIPIVLMGPSGVGKGTIIKEMMKRKPDAFGFSVSHTSRGPRQGEVDGKDYVFETREHMEQLIAEGAFIEHANVHGNMYGTSYKGVQKVLDSGRICIIEIDVQGASQLRKKNFEAHYIFINAPSKDELHRRLVGRGTETPEAVDLRFHNAVIEIERAEKDKIPDRYVVNDTVERAVDEIFDIIKDDLLAQAASSPAPKY